jgi:superfamily I DNA/RNA helicase
MNDLLKDQGGKRQSYLDRILKSDHPRKLIVAGPGTGKTFTFNQVLGKVAGSNNLAITFIRKLVEDMDEEFGELAEVKTFHAYCKKLLHQERGRVDLLPFLTSIIESDAKLLARKFSDFDAKFQKLQDDSPEIAFYLDRGDYYEAVSFNDSVYRLYRMLQREEFELPLFQQIVVDEYQDFNALEVAFIDELQKRGSILIVGDDDQAVYRARNSSPDHLREKYRSGEYEVFELPFCSRCPKVIVDAANAFVERVIKLGAFRDRIPRAFVPFLEGKDYENEMYPKIIVGTTTNIPCLTKLVASKIQGIPEADISESHEKKYPTVLVVGQRQYRNPIFKRLSKAGAHVEFRDAGDSDQRYAYAYQLLLVEAGSNLGWRILAELEIGISELKRVINKTVDGTKLYSLLDEEFKERHEQVLELLRNEVSEENQEKLRSLLGEHYASVAQRTFEPDTTKEEIDTSKPTILLSSFEGCKGLSAGHVFIVGLNDGSMPRVQSDGTIEDIEVSKFLVALTRTMKCCYLFSNKWLYSPKNALRRSCFVEMIRTDFVENLGFLKGADVD